MSVFAELVGQSHIVLALQDAVAASRNGTESQEMTHAWLFTGPPGSGRSSAAIAFAAALICPEGGCGTCIDCRTAAAGGHADVEILRSEVASMNVNNFVVRPKRKLVEQYAQPQAWKNLPLEAITALEGGEAERKP